METEKNISGVSENLADAIAEQETSDEKQLENLLFYGKRIAVSVSESEELEQLGLSDHHLKDISIEIARYLIANGATLLYGGDLRSGGYTELFSELSFQYKYLKDRKFRFVNYFPFPNSKYLTTDVRAKFYEKQVDVKILEIPKKLGEIDKERKYEPFERIEDRYILAECFTDMREQMAKDSNARIVLGGRQTNFLGYFPGIVEETYHSLKANKPVYLLGGFGGAAKAIISVITGDKPYELSNEFQFNTDFLKDFKSYSLDKSSINLDYDKLNSFFQNYTIKSISQQNGLTPEENQILFERTNIHELVFLIIKGLKNITEMG